MPPNNSIKRTQPCHFMQSHKASCGARRESSRDPITGIRYRNYTATFKDVSCQQCVEFLIGKREAEVAYLKAKIKKEIPLATGLTLPAAPMEV